MRLCCVGGGGAQMVEERLETAFRARSEPWDIFGAAALLAQGMAPPPSWGPVSHGPPSRLFSKIAAAQNFLCPPFCAFQNYLCTEPPKLYQPSTQFSLPSHMWRACHVHGLLGARLPCEVLTGRLYHTWRACLKTLSHVGCSRGGFITPGLGWRPYHTWRACWEALYCVGCFSGGPITPGGLAGRPYHTWKACQETLSHLRAC
jgi:hypothetical protein